MQFLWFLNSNEDVVCYVYNTDKLSKVYPETAKSALRTFMPLIREYDLRVNLAALRHPYTLALIYFSVLYP